MARKSNAKYRTVYHSLSLVCQRVPPRHLHLLHQHLHPENPATERSGSKSAQLRENPLQECLQFIERATGRVSRAEAKIRSPRRQVFDRTTIVLGATR